MIDPVTYARCQQVLCIFWSALDHRRIDELMTLITDDMRWQREKMYEGKDAIRQAIAARPANLHIRHLMSNLVVEERDEGSLEAQFILAPVYAMVEGDATAPYPSDMFATVAEFRATLRASSEAVRVSSIAFEMLFHRPA